MNNNFCNFCSFNVPQFILNCGCFFCSNCYELTKSFIDCDKTKCYACEQNIYLSMTIDVNKKNISNQITKYNKKENNQIILYKLKVNNIYNILFYF